jgi:hypothetical protein
VRTVIDEQTTRRRRQARLRRAAAGLCASISVGAFIVSSCGSESANRRTNGVNLMDAVSSEKAANDGNSPRPAGLTTPAVQPELEPECDGVVALQVGLEGSGGFLSVGHSMAVPVYGLQADGRRQPLEQATITLDGDLATINDLRTLTAVSPGTVKLTAKACALTQATNLVVTSGPTPLEAERCKAWRDSMAATLSAKATCFSKNAATAATPNCASQKSAYDLEMEKLGDCLRAASNTCQVVSDAVDRAAETWLACLDSGADSACGEVVAAMRQHCSDYGASLCAGIEPAPTACKP